MQEKIRAYNSELDNIKMVVDKLVTKQNSSVFDKLCDMCNALFIRVCDYNKSELTQGDVRDLINVLKRLYDICITLVNYKEYLINAIKDNIETLRNQEKDNSQGEIIYEIEEVPVVQLNEINNESLNTQTSDISKLQLKQFQEKDVA